MRVRLTREICQGHARCAAVAPDIYTLDDNGYCDIDEVDIAPGREQDARRGIASCPERALSVVEE